MAAKRPDPSALDALQEFEHREAQWRRVDELLRRLIGRLTYAAEGRTVTLDAALGTLRRATRKPVEEGAIQPLLDALADAARSLDDDPPAPRAAAPAAATPAPAPDAARAESAATTTGTVLLRIVELLRGCTTEIEPLTALQEQIGASHDESAWLACGEAIAGLVDARVRQLEEQRRIASELLDQVNRQLTTLAEHLDQDDASRRGVVEDRRQLRESMLGEVRALGDSARTAPDLATLQSHVQQRLTAVSQHLTALREREQAREKVWERRTRHMRERIHELESSTQRMEATLEQERKEADTDALTGLANRRALETCMATLCDGTPGAMSLVILDIDHFKTINDTLGHSAGDRALRIVAEQLQAALRPGDFLARYGGEEFVAVLNAGAAEAMQVAERLRERIEKVQFHSQQQPVAITLSGGVATVHAGDTPATVFERADRALYQAKSGGRNRCAMLAG